MKYLKIKNQKPLARRCLSIIISFCMVAALFSACRDQQWDEHNKISDEAVTLYLLEAIQAHPDGSKFYEAAVKAGYDSLLMQPANFTVFVPKNEAWQNVDMNDLAALRSIVANHIAYGRFLWAHPEQHPPLQMVNQKMMKYDSPTQTINGATIVSLDHITGNGVFHITDRRLELKKNVWEYITSEFTSYKQVKYLISLNDRVMDMERSVQLSFNIQGQPVYDTAWININNFLNLVPLDKEDSTLTYVLLKDNGFDFMFGKYRKYFTRPTEESTDSLTKFNVSMDFFFRGIEDITKTDLIENAFGSKVPMGSNVTLQADVYEASNGRVYVIDKSNILLSEKFKPVIIEGENFNRSSSNSLLYVRYKPEWASGGLDVMLSCSSRQTDDIPLIDEDGNPLKGKNGADLIISALSRTFQWSTDNRSNINNFYIEYKANVSAGDYEIHYKSYNDMQHGNDNLYEGYTLTAYLNPVNNIPQDTVRNYVFKQGQNYPLRFDQKLFISLPGERTLRKNDDSKIENNFLSNICFASQDTVGINKERVMRQWYIDQVTPNMQNMQFVDWTRPVEGEEATILTVPQAGELTLWLCNTSRENTQSAQGILFLDYIKLVPKMEEPDENE